MTRLCELVAAHLHEDDRDPDSRFLGAEAVIVGIETDCSTGTGAAGRKVRLVRGQLR